MKGQNSATLNARKKKKKYVPLWKQTFRDASGIKEVTKQV
jgi:hypothetical protein